MANRDHHRQGLVYGPVRPSGPRDRGRIVGNLLGLLVVVVTVSVLVLAIYFFLQARGTQPLPPGPPAASVAATLQPTPSASLTARPSASAVAAASVEPSPLPPTIQPTLPPTEPTATPVPTLLVPPVMSGPGFITFGTIADAGYHVTDPKTTFAIDEPMVWSAHLSEAADSVDLRIRILILDPTQTTGQRLVREDAVEPQARGVQIFFRRLRPIGVSAGAGLFTIEYVRGDQILAQGSFLVQ